MKAHTHAEDGLVHIPLDQVVTNSFERSLGQMSETIPDLIGSIALIDDRLQQLRAVQSAGKVAEGLLELMQLSNQHRVPVESADIEPHAKPASVIAQEYAAVDDPVRVQNHEAGPADADLPHATGGEIAALGVTGGQEPLDTASEQQINEVASNEDALASREITVEMSAVEAITVSTGVPYEELIKDITGKAKPVVEHILQNPLETIFRPLHLRPLTESGSVEAQKQVITRVFNYIKKHPVLGDWLKEDGTRSNLRYWLSRPQAVAEVGKTLETDEDGSASDEVASPVRHPITLSRVAIELAGGALGGGKAKDEDAAFRLNGGRPMARPNPIMMGPRQQPTLEQHSKAFSAEKATTVPLTTDGLQIMEHGGVRRLYWQGEHLQIASSSANIIELVSLFPEGVTFEQLRRMVEKMNKERPDIARLTAQLESIGKTLKESGFAGWENGFREVEGETHRVLCLNNVAPRNKEDWPDFLMDGQLAKA